MPNSSSTKMSSPVELPPPAAGRVVDRRAPVPPTTADPACCWDARAPRLSRPRTAPSAARAGAGGDESSCVCVTPACSSRCFRSTCACRTDGCHLHPACFVVGPPARLAYAVLYQAAPQDPICERFSGEVATQLRCLQINDSNAPCGPETPET